MKNEKDYFYMVLSDLKCIEKNYITFLSETSNDRLFKKVKNDFDKIIDLQRTTFYLMNNEGWYNLKNTTKTLINDSLNKMSKELCNKA